MHHQRTLDVTESRVGLSLLICLLLAAGYIILERMGGAGQAPPVEVRAGFHTAPVIGDSQSRDYDEQQPQVLAIEGSDAPAIHTSPRTALSPKPPAQSDLR